MEIQICRPLLSELEAITKLFQTTVKNNLIEEGILETERLEELTNDLLQILALDFESEGKKEYHLLAKVKNEIVGTIAFGPPNSMILDHLKIDLSGCPEIKSVYILPSYQNKGIGSRLFQEILLKLSEQKVNEFCLDSGYTRAQKYWTKKLGSPKYILPDYWTPGSSHMIWHSSIPTLD